MTAYEESQKSFCLRVPQRVRKILLPKVVLMFSFRGNCVLIVFDPIMIPRKKVSKKLMLRSDEIFVRNKHLFQTRFSRTCDSMSRSVYRSVRQSVRRSVTQCENTPWGEKTCITAFAHPYATDAVVYTALFPFNGSLIVYHLRSPWKRLFFTITNFDTWHLFLSLSGLSFSFTIPLSLS